jgi:hypothetical protein
MIIGDGANTNGWYIAAHVWKIYDFKIEVVPLIINFSTELTTVVKSKIFETQFEAASMLTITAT